MRLDRCSICDYTGFTGSALLDKSPNRDIRTSFREDCDDTLCDECYGIYLQQLFDFRILDKEEEDGPLGEDEPTLSLREEQ